VNAFIGETGKATNALTGEKSQHVARVARHYRSEKVRWGAVGDANYGEGSSREHAALSPPSSRIHEGNLKKHGLLALTFGDPADYDLIHEDDRISLIGLDAMAPGKLVEYRVRHADGMGVPRMLRRTCSGDHIRWFRAGSVLNELLKQ